MSNAERMLKQESKIVALGIPCELTVTLDYRNISGVVVVLTKGSKVWVDMEKGIASVGNDFFEIERAEYQSLLLN